MKILIIKLGALGDVVRSSYFLHGLLKKLGSSAYITWVTSERAIPLLKYHPAISVLLTFEEIAEKKVSWGRQEFDWIISLDDESQACGLLQGITWTRLTGAYLKDKRVDYSEDASPWFDMGLISRLGKEKADSLKKLNQKTHDQIFAGILGIKVSEPNFYNSPGALKIARQLLGGKAGHFLGLNLSAGNRWLNKQLGNNQAKLLVENLSRAGFPLLLLGGTEDEVYNGWLSRETGCPLLPSVSLGTFAAVISQLRAIITADTLALHLAIAQRIPSVSFFAPTSAAEINTFGKGLKVISTASDYCNYQSNADNSTITAERLFDAFFRLPGQTLQKRIYK
jgi:heptosyltransferase-2